MKVHTYAKWLFNYFLKRCSWNHGTIIQTENTFLFHDEAEKNYKLLIRNINSKWKKQDFQHQYQRQVKMCIYLYLFVSWLFVCKVSFVVCIYKHHFLMYKCLPELTKRRSKVQEKNMSCEHALNFDKWKTFPKTISQ